MIEPRVEFESIWKRFDRGERHDSLRDLLPAMLGRMWERRARDAFWALQDVSFAVSGGEALGIIGPNGAGKSTILKLLTRLLEPTQGRCLVRGRIGALIEVAAGFHPDLTGRENIYLQGAIHGMRRKQIRERLDAIVDFAGVGPFLDTPVKRYSSGMNARLGFSIAAHLDPDVLIIDEVLGVGDLAFRQKCYERMLAFRRRGVAIVFVSHDLPSVVQLCERAVLLHKGSVLASGPARDVVARYSAETLVSQVFDEATLHVHVREPHAAGEAWLLAPGDRIALTAEVDFHRDVETAGLNVEVSDLLRNVSIYSATTERAGVAPRAMRRGDRVSFDLSLEANLTDGLYTLAVAALDTARGVPVSTAWKLRFSVRDAVAVHGPANLFLRCRHTRATRAPRAAATLAASS